MPLDGETPGPGSPAVSLTSSCCDDGEVPFSCSLRSDALSVYSACHSGVMSVGSHKGKSHCGAELAALHACVFGR